MARIIVSGASGLIGRVLVEDLKANGHSVVRLVRRSPKDGDILWNPARGEINARSLEGCDAVVHLSGESVAGRWTAGKKARIRDSRVQSTAFLASTLASLQAKPPVWVCASAIGIYGNRGDETLTENSTPGSGFLADICREWEAAALPARDAGIRVVHARFGVVFSRRGGAFPRLALPFRVFLGGPIGRGDQYWSWLTDADAAGIIRFTIENDSVTGPVNAVSPQPVTNLDLARVLARVLHRPAEVPVPAFMLRLMFGAMADETLLASERVVPQRLMHAGYIFNDPDLEEALRKLTGRGSA